MLEQQIKYKKVKCKQQKKWNFQENKLMPRKSKTYKQ